MKKTSYVLDYSKKLIDKVVVSITHNDYTKVMAT